MTKNEQDIIDGTKEFAKTHNIHYNQMTENMILNALRGQLILSGVVQQSELYSCECKVCGKPFGDKLSLYEHYDEEHN
tara:strand:- start:43 stop:276 length:234 start_codon:yes stop_codon:yes gene_type:complete